MKQLVDKFIKSYGSPVEGFKGMFYNESKSVGVDIASLLEDFANDILENKLIAEQNKAILFNEWLNDEGWIRDPFPRKEYDDDKLRYSNIAVISADSEDELSIYTIEELYEKFENKNNS